ncbi:MAG: right-handed parallel beta-helix repeat-containing protein [Candidatus Micrarchaeota archaeon]
MGKDKGKPVLPFTASDLHLIGAVIVLVLLLAIATQSAFPNLSEGCLDEFPSGCFLKSSGAMKSMVLSSERYSLVRGPEHEESDSWQMGSEGISVSDFTSSLVDDFVSISTGRGVLGDARPANASGKLQKYLRVRSPVFGMRYDMDNGTNPMIFFYDSPIKRMRVYDWINNGLLEVDWFELEGYEQAYAINPAGVNSAEATITAKGNIVEKCREWDFATRTCNGEWIVLTRVVPGENYTIAIDSADPGFRESLSVINVQSFPEVGGLWTVQFNTTGTADLTISAVNGTTWTNFGDSEDLRFLEVRCGDAIMPYSWVNDSVLIEDYTCNETGTETSRVITGGSHHLEFRFGDSVDYAHNQAGIKVILLRGAGGDINSTDEFGVNWTTEDRVDTTAFSHSTSADNYGVTVAEDGIYRVSYGLYVNTNGTDRYSPLAHVNVDGSSAGVCYSSGYNRGTSESWHLVAAAGCLLELTAGQSVSIAAKRLSTTITEQYPVFNSSNSWFHMQKLEHSDVILLREAGGGQEFDTVNASVTWDTEDYEGGSFTHAAGSSEIQVSQTGFYRLTYSIGVEEDTQNRSAAFVNLQVKPDGGSFADTPYGWGQAYLRGIYYINESIVAASTVLNLSALDTVRAIVGNPTGYDPGVLSVTGGRTHLDMEYLGDGSDTDMFMAYDSTGSVILENHADQTWDVEDYDGSYFTFTPGNAEITIDRPGLYQIAYGVYSTSNNSGRFEWLTQLFVNGAAASECLGAGYNRGVLSYGSPEAASTSNCYIELEAGDVVKVQNIETTNLVSGVNNTGDRTFMTIQGMNFPTPEVSGCAVIDYPGQVQMSADGSGAPNGVSGVTDITSACIVLASDDIDFSCNGHIIDNTVFPTAAGIVINGSTTVDYTNVTIRDCPSITDYAVGAYIHNSQQDTIRNVTTDRSTTAGILLRSATSTTVENCTAKGNYNYGFYLRDSFTNTLSNDIAYNNSINGFRIYTSQGNVINKSQSYNNTDSGIHIEGYFGADVPSQQNSVINSSSYDNDADGVELVYTTLDNVLDSNFSNNGDSGVHMRDNAFATYVQSCRAYDNSENGFYAASGALLANFDDNIAYDNGLAGLNNTLATSTTADNTTAYGNLDGIAFESGSCTFTGANLYNNTRHGVYYKSTAAATFNDIHSYSADGVAVMVENTGGGTPAITFSNLTIDSDTGDFVNYTSLDITDNINANSAYSINWSSSSGTPTDTESFAQKLVNISPVSGTTSIDTIVWNWLEPEASGIDESSLELWKYNSSGWALQNDSPDTTGNTLRILSMNPASDYGLFENLGSCRVISAPGEYQLNINLTGAPLTLSGISGFAKACYIISSDDVDLSCAGRTITNNGTASAAGIVVNGSSTVDYTNVTIRDCIVSGYRADVMLYDTAYDTVINNTALNASLAGIYTYLTNYSVIENNNATDSVAQSGLRMAYSSLNNVSGNHFSNASRGFYLELYSNFNRITNNSAYNCSTQGFLVYTYSSGNVLIGNDAWDIVNNAYVVRDYTDNNTLIDNTASYSNNGFLMLYNSTNTTIINFTSFNNRNVNFAMWDCDGTLLANSTSYNGTLGDIWYRNVLGHPYSLEMSNITILNPLGTYENYSVISIQDSLTTLVNYTINWTDTPAGLPAGRETFANKYLEIGRDGSEAIDNFTWHWTAAEAEGHDANNFELWRYNVTDGWSLINDSPDVLANQISLPDFSPSSDYGILEDAACRIISSPGSYSLASNASGAPYGVPAAYADAACIVIDSSDVDFNCNGYNISNDGTANAAAIFVNGTASTQHTNVTIRDCPHITEYTRAVYIEFSPGAIVRNVSMHDLAGSGIMVFASNQLNLTNNSFDNLTAQGIQIYDSNYSHISYNLINAAANSMYFDNSHYNTIEFNDAGFASARDYNLVSSDNNMLRSNTGHGNTGASFRLSGATNTTILNCTMYNNARGVRATTSNYTNITNCTTYNNTYGLHIDLRSQFASVTDIISAGDYYGIWLDESSWGNISDVSIVDSYEGIWVYKSNHSLIGNVFIENATNAGVQDYPSFNNTYTDITIINSFYGFQVYNSTDINLSNLYTSNNGFDIRVTANGTEANINFTNITIDNPLGGYENYTVLNITDTTGLYSDFFVNWTGNSSELPAGYLSFAQKFVNISSELAPASIDSVVWGWKDGELGGYDEGAFGLWKYNESGWTLENGTPDTSGNTLRLLNMDPASDYGILQEGEQDCYIISAPGAYMQTANVSGAPVTLNGDSNVDWACIIIDSDNVDYSCEGFSMINDGTADAVAIVVNGSDGNIRQNVTVRDCKLLEGYEYGMFAKYARNVIFENSTADCNYTGRYGFIMYPGVNDSIIRNTWSYDGLNNGIHTRYGWNDTVYNSFAQNFSLGSNIYVLNMYHSSYYNNTMMDGQTGLELRMSENISVDNCTAGGTFTHYAIRFNAGVDRINFSRNVGYGGVNALLIGTSNYMNITNCSFYGTSLNAVYLDDSGYSNFTDILIDDAGSYGIYLRDSTTVQNRFSGITITDSAQYGIRSYDAHYNLFENARIENVGFTGHGINVDGGSGFNNYTNITISGIVRDGIFITNNAGNNTFTDMEIYDVGYYGIEITNGDNNNFTNIHLYNNSRGAIYVSSTGSARNVKFSNVSIDNPSGGYVNYTTLSITDSIDVGTAYNISWTTNSSPLLGPYLSIGEKFVNISNSLGSTSIDSIAWSWLDSEAAGYDESSFRLHKWNGSWTDTGAALDTGANTLSLTNMDPASDYGIVGYSSPECFVIDAPGSYSLSSDLEGAPFPVTGISSGNRACILIMSDDVEFDCNGYNLTNNGTADAIGIAANGTSVHGYENVSIRNCFNISDYKSSITVNNITTGIIENILTEPANWGIYVQTSNDMTIRNCTVSGGIGELFYIRENWNMTVTGNLAHSCAITNNGFYLLNNDDTILDNNTAYLCQRGFYIQNLRNSTVTNSVSHSNVRDGYYFYVSPDNVSFTGNVAYNNSINGIYLHSGPNNMRITNNSFHDNGGDGIQLSGPVSNILIEDNLVISNRARGIDSTGASNIVNITINNNTFYNTSNYVIWLSSVVDSNITNNIIDTSTGNSGIQLWSLATGNRIVNNTISNTGGDGIQVGFTNDNEIYNCTIENSGDDGISIRDANETDIHNVHVYGSQGADLRVESAGSPRNLRIYNMSFDNPDGNWQNYTSLNITDTVEAGTAYTINWTANSSPLSAPMISFRSKYVEITATTGTVSIDSVVWHWLESELGGYSESQFALWKHNGSIWSSVNDTPDTSGNTLMLLDLNPASKYGIVQFGESCPIISEPTTYIMNASYSGAPNAGDADVAFTCAKISSSDVIYDCNGYSLSIDGGPDDASGILIGGAISNITLRNCPSISGYDYGIYMDGASSNVVQDITLNDNVFGLFINGSQDILISNVDIYDNNESGVTIIEQSDNITLSNVEVYGNDQYGVHIENSNDVNLSTAHLYDNAQEDVYVSTDGTPRAFYASNLRIDSDSGLLQNYTTLTIEDTVDANRGYTIDWAVQPGSLPANTSSFNGKFVDITEVGGDVFIDRIVWAWLDSEVGGHRESEFGLWRYSAAVWSLQNDSPDTEDNELSLFAMNPASDYGILESINASLSGSITLYGANITNITHAQRYNGTNGSGANLSVRGGNITIAETSVGTALTDRWAAFYGNVSGSVILTTNNTYSYVYEWEYNSSQSTGAVCASTNATLETFAVKGATAGDIDTAWSFDPSIADSGANTFNGSDCIMGVGETFISNSSWVDTGQSGGFITCALRSNSTTAATKSDLLFCGNVSAGTNWNGTISDFELLVPTSYGAGTETYYFYANLE